jgi:hypothetical protein
VERIPLALGSAARTLRLALVAWTVAGSAVACVTEPEPVADDDSEETPADGSEGSVLVGPETNCAAPQAGFNRIDEQAAARGVDLEYPGDPTPTSCSVVPGGVVVRDLDLDGDDDLLFYRREGFPWLYVNDGVGHFESREIERDVLGTFGRQLASHAAVDLNADGLPDVIGIGDGIVVVSWNLGALDFSEFEILYMQEGYPCACFNSAAFGDVDGDGDLDLFVPGLVEVPYEGWIDEGFPYADAPPSFSRCQLLLGDGSGAFEPAPEHIAPGRAGLSILAFFTDRDSDGDLDIFLSSDRPQIPDNPPSAFYRNDSAEGQGLLALSDDAADIGADLRISGMGLGSGDLNGDGRLDYCMSDVNGQLPCLLSDGEAGGGYYEGGAALGLVAELRDMPSQGNSGFSPWSTWSVEMVDLDNDGRRDVATVAGPPPDRGNVANSDLPQFQPDAIWQGVDGGVFEERTYELGFDDGLQHYGMASSDLDGDGYRELIVGTFSGRPGSPAVQRPHGPSRARSRAPRARRCDWPQSASVAPRRSSSPPQRVARAGRSRWRSSRARPWTFGPSRTVTATGSSGWATRAGAWAASPPATARSGPWHCRKAARRRPASIRRSGPTSSAASASRTARRATSSSRRRSSRRPAASGRGRCVLRRATSTFACPSPPTSTASTTRRTGRSCSPPSWTRSVTASSTATPTCRRALAPSPSATRACRRWHSISRRRAPPSGDPSTGA